nr:MAG: phosphatidylglycerophosphatase A [Hyphomicrobiales bacterium]
MTKFAVFVSTVFGIGDAPFAPGTVASLAALPIGYLILLFGGAPYLLLVCLFVIGLGIWASGLHAQSIGRDDPGSSAIDEVAGQFLAMLPLVPRGSTSDAIAVVAAFVLFRFFDIIKPWPISRLERLAGGMGIMADDIAAGLVSAALLFGALHWGLI